MHATVSGMLEVSTGEAAELVAGGALLLDVREVDEWTAGHVAGALFMPMGEVEARIGELPRDRRVVVICRVGGRSGAVTEFLTAAGLDAVNLAGGITAWDAEHRPIVTDDGSPGAVV